MIQVWKELLGSKKFWLTILGSAVCTGLQAAGVSHELVLLVGSLFGANVMGQGLADFGKNRPR